MRLYESKTLCDTIMPIEVNGQQARPVLVETKIPAPKGSVVKIYEQE